MDSNKIEDLLEDWYLKFSDIPRSLHLLCPKVDDEDDEDYDDTSTANEISLEEKQKRIQDGEKRIEMTYWSALLLAYPKDKAGIWLTTWSDRMLEFVHNCDKCVTNWHKRRREFLRKFAATWNDSVAEDIKRVLMIYDFSRLDKGLVWVANSIEAARKEGRIFNKADLGDHQASVLLAIFEALCYMEYLSVPEKRATFQVVFDQLSSKKPLKLGNNVLLPAMTYFLFDQNETRYKFAVKSYNRITPGTVSFDQFEWAIHNELKAVMERAQQWHPADPEVCLEVENFWKSINMVLRVLNADVMLRGLRSIDAQPGLCDLLFNLIHCQSEGALMQALQVLATILDICPQVIRDTIKDARPFVVVEQIFLTPQIRPILAQALTFTYQDETDPNTTTCYAVTWITSWMNSLKLSEKSDACEQLFRLLFVKEKNDGAIGPQGLAACLRAGFDVLESALQAFLTSDLDNTVGSSLAVCANQLLNVVLSYKDTINDAFSNQSDMYFQLGVQSAAMKVIRTTLVLDAKMTASEHRVVRAEETKNIQNGIIPSKAGPTKLRTTVPRDSPGLWEAFSVNFESGRHRMNQYMLSAMGPYLTLDVFRPSRKYPSKPDAVVTHLSTEFTKIMEVCARFLLRMTDFPLDELQHLCIREQQIRVILPFCFHSNEEVREGSRSVIRCLGGNPDEMFDDALRKLLCQHLQITMNSLNFGFLQITNATTLLWGFAEPSVKISRTVVDALCDTSSGILRSRDLDVGEVNSLNVWWMAQWRFIQAAFDATTHWSSLNEVEVMKRFCRDNIDLADVLMANSGVVASAIQNNKGSTADPTAVGSAMNVLLREPKDRLVSITNMIRLRDFYLVETTVKVVCRLLTRLRNNSHEIPAESKRFVVGACIKKSDGRYSVPSNINDQLRAELLEALGHEQEESEEEDVQVISIRPAADTTKKKQSTIDQWSKSGDGSSRRTSNADDVKALSSSVDKNRSALSAMLARQAAKPKATPLAPKPKPDASQGRALIESRKQAMAEKKKRDAAAIAQAKALRGPELKGVSGVVGKDHAPQKNEMLVDTDEEDSEDSDDDDDVKALISKGQQGKKAVDEATRRRERALLEKTKGPVKKTRVVRTAKDMRARLIPPMDQLHQAILEWDIFHEGNDPPNLQPCSRVNDTYPQPEQYKDTFWRLLVSEAWRSFVTSKDETTSKAYGVKIASRMTVDRFLEVTASIPAAENKDRKLSEGDIILFSQATAPLTAPGEPHSLARIWKTTFKRDLLEVTYRFNSKNNPLQSNLQIGAELNAVKITNMTTIEREYAALESLKYYDLMDEVLKAEPSPILKYSDEMTQGVMANYQLNPGQAKAILGAKDNDGFTLIQGPPGTGKTKTIIAMVGSLMTGNIQPAGAVALPRQTGTQNAQQQAQPKKILVCAPSNAAVDELVLRLKQGIKTMGTEQRPGSTHKINVLRLGRSDAINAAVRDVTLDELVKKRLEGDTTKDKMKAEKDKLHSDAARIRDQLAEIRPQMDAARANDREQYLRLQRQFDTLKRDQTRIGAQIDADKESGNTLTRELEIKRKQVQQEILDGAQVLCATLSGSGHEMFKNLKVDFETVIIDEAAQCVELSALIPLKYGCTKCILVGDPKQLPPTVLSQSAAKFGYDQSLFVRMQRNHPEHIHMLDTQYRMHPSISYFPSQEFYEAKLFDGDKMAELRVQPWHSSPLLGPYRFFDVEGTQGRGHKGQSLINMQEIQVAMKLYARFRADFSGKIDTRGKMGIITPYKAQLQELRSRFTMEYGEKITEDIEFNTTDAFQGRECEIIIFSCVRASPSGGIGFMKDIRRMNVGLTRAKSSLWILGDSRALVQGEFWSKLIDDAKRREFYTKGNILSMLSKPGHMLPPPQPSAAQPGPSSNGPSGDVPMQDVSSRPASAAHDRPARNAAEWESRNHIGSIDVNGQPIPPTSRLDAAPVIQTSAPLQPSENKKRPHDGGADDQSHGAKRVASGQQRGSLSRKFGGRHNAPSGPKTMRQHQDRGPKEPQPSKDPSAMEALGLTPPSRPPPPPQAPNPGMPSGQANQEQLPASGGLDRVKQIQQRAQTQNQQPPHGPRRNKKKDGGSMFIQRKPNKR